MKSGHTAVIASPSNALDEFVTFHLVSATVLTADPNQPQTKSALQKGDGKSFGIAVPGKPGFITSPHAPDAGYVDVRGFPSGAEIKCPYSGKFLMVP